MSRAKIIMEKRQQVAKLVTDVRALMDKADFEKRSLSQEERNSISTMEKDIDRLEDEANLEERQLERERKLGGDPKPGLDPKPEDRAKPRASEEYRSAYSKYLLDGPRAIYTEAEMRAIQADNAITGGMFMSPTQFVDELIRDIDNNVVIAGLSRNFTITTAQSLGAPSLDNDIDDADWTAEIQAAAETSDIKIGERELTPHQASKLVKISNKLLSYGTQSPDTLVRERLGYKFGITQEKVFMTGDGSQKPLGLFTASPLGISTSYDIQTGSATDMTADGLMDALYDLKEGYQKKATWLFHRDAVKKIRKLKDSTNTYIWQPGLSGGNPPLILERPYVISEYVPNTFTSGKYVGIVGDFSYYWIVKRFGLAIQVLKELYAVTNQTGYIGRLEVDAMPVLGAAFRRLKTN